MFLLIWLLSGSTSFAVTIAKNHVEEAYKRAVQDASVVEQDEISYDLIAIHPDNKSLIWNADKTKILVVSWKSNSSYEDFLKPKTDTATDETHVVWVTAVPQIQRFCQRYIRANPDATAKDINLRLKQYLGLHPDWHYDVFVEMWVSPEDLFRPCVDPEIDDSHCNLRFGNTEPVVKGIRNYPVFYKNLYYSDFRTPPGIPWTGLGYTFDWENPSAECGASEFILVPGAAYEIKGVFPTVDYCNRHY